ncbi:MAG TPA: T9SS type A sorting domain-containing protein [Puia sp.]|nr:T9SS type A sorting domain-containing protein [Puia sp.]
MKSSFKYALLAILAVLSSAASFANPTSHFHPFIMVNAADTGLRHNTQADAGFSPIILQGTLVGFNATYGKNSFDLHWNSLPETRCERYEIERSLDGEHYEKLGEIRNGAMYTASSDYSFTDHVRPAVARKNDFYYRLKQVDADGHVSYSKTLIARMYNSRSLAALSVTPDPVINDILVNVQVKEEKAFVVMKITDQAGNEVMRQTAQTENEVNTYKIEGTHELHPGTYFLEVIVNSNERLQMKLIKG